MLLKLASHFTSTNYKTVVAVMLQRFLYYMWPYMRIYVHLQPGEKIVFFNYNLSKPYKINQKLVFSLFFSLLHKKIGEKKLKSSKHYLYQAKLLFWLYSISWGGAFLNQVAPKLSLLSNHFTRKSCIFVLFEYT